MELTLLSTSPGLSETFKTQDNFLGSEDSLKNVPGNGANQATTHPAADPAGPVVRWPSKAEITGITMHLSHFYNGVPVYHYQINNVQYNYINHNLKLSDLQ